MTEFETLVGESLGRASVAWSEAPAGVFDPDTCLELQRKIVQAHKVRVKAVGVCDEVMAERARQEEKWGEQNHDPFKYLAILGEEVGEANKAALEAYDFEKRLWKTEIFSKDKNSYREELIQVAAVAIAMIECLDRENW